MLSAQFLPMEEFYTVNSKNISPDQWNLNVSLNPEHSVYKGHFPQKGVAPGVMLTQMIKNIVEDELGKELKMSSARNIKFLNMMLPESAGSVDIQLQVKEEDQIVVSAVAKIGEDIYFKISACFV